MKHFNPDERGCKEQDRACCSIEQTRTAVDETHFSHDAGPERWYHFDEPVPA
ncbi:hypothetical protein [Pseudaminobacter sp. NGMCC 1.201702]|uniref:hypothetical protein n=1 Tax=Pseudaminobacter sp. NGMCC 1.201702 TaxID=3391825 RepID=UPI0039EE7954